VLATLWKVADASTAQLMRDFYVQRSQGQPGLSRAQALRLAQLAMLQGPAAPTAPAASTQRAAVRTTADAQALKPLPADPNRPWARPYYWAPFVLSGSWL